MKVQRKRSSRKANELDQENLHCTNKIIVRINLNKTTLKETLIEKQER